MRKNRLRRVEEGRRRKEEENCKKERGDRWAVVQYIERKGSH